MSLFKTGDLLNAPGIKIVTACSYLTVDRHFVYGKGTGKGVESQGPWDRRDIRKDGS